MAKENKILSFVKEHKEMLLLTGVVIVGGALVVCSRRTNVKVPNLTKTSETLAHIPEDIDIPENISKYVSEIWRDWGNTAVHCIMQPMPVGDIPNAVSCIKDNLDFLNNDTIACSMISFDT